MSDAHTLMVLGVHVSDKSQLSELRHVPFLTAPPAMKDIFGGAVSSPDDALTSLSSSIAPRAAAETVDFASARSAAVLGLVVLSSRRS